MRYLTTCLPSFVTLILALSPVRGTAEDSTDHPPKLQIINGSQQTCDIRWLKSATESIPHGSLEPGKETIIPTTLGHRYEIVGHDGLPTRVVTSEVPVQAFRYDPQDPDGVPAFYTQRVKAHDFPIVASAKVNPYALKEAVYLVDMMLAKRPDVRAAMIRSGARMCVMAHNEYTTDLPEFIRMAGEKDEHFPELPAKDFWDARARGLGGSDTDPYCSVAEENVLCFPGDPYALECILIHEFAHNIHLRGMLNVDPTFDTRLQATYDAAMKAGLWKGKYAAMNRFEYFAEGVQSWFDNNRVNDHDHNHVHLRWQLIEYDPGLAAMCREVFGDTELKYSKPITRLTGHMEGYDPAKAPAFVWPERLEKAKAAIRAQAVARDQAANGGTRPAATGDTMSLAGNWRFRLDAKDVGVNEKWYSQSLDDNVQLPGTTDENQKGLLKDEHCIDRLSRVWYWKGPAWYQRQVTIADGWKGKHITLMLERTKHTRVWVDQTYCGGDDTLSAPQVIDLTPSMTPGEHTLTVVVDNAKLPPVGPAHAVDERTQTNWNGIIGRIELRATDPVWLDDVQVYPHAANKQAVVHAVVGNLTGAPATGKITINCTGGPVGKPVTFKSQTVEFQAADKSQVIECVYQPGDEVPLWDEFQPALLHLTLKLEAAAGGQASKDERTVAFGMRDFKREGNILTNNGHPVFLRGRLDCANYPLTAYPPMDRPGWLKVLSILKAWGLNHVRFHSWCPPEEAFAAADELGMYFQVELPNKSSAFKAPDSKEAAAHNIDWLKVEDTLRTKPLYEYAEREGELIFKHFGNHPSFVMFTLGNELGRNPGMFEMVAHFKKTDPRHLYAQGSNNMHWAAKLAEGDDFWVTGKTGKTLPLRGSFYINDYPNPHIESFPPSTMVDYRKSIEGIPVPLIGHETGQFQVYPDFRELPRYTGVLRARNMEVFRDRLQAAGMLDQAHDFVRASGALSAICYREDIEAALRTPGMGGFQLLDIQDFPGQGTALVGMLNDFMESKGIIEPDQWRQFCCETVPLLRMEKYTWTTAETFKGRVQVAHYGPADMPAARVTATLTDSQGKRVGGQAFPPAILKQGQLNEVGDCVLPLAGLAAPQQLTLTLVIEGTAYRNSYPLWIYPPQVDTRVPAGVMLTESYAAEATRKHLAAGGKVLLIPKPERLPLSIEGEFQCDFWSPMFVVSAKKSGGKVPAGTLGILCDPAAPPLAEFPTEFHSNWQWWQLVKHARPIILDDTPATYRPLVQVIDNFVSNHKLGLLAETRVGPGKLLICAIDLPSLQEFPEGRQLLHSLLRYADSPAFAPRAELDAKLLEKLLP